MPIECRFSLPSDKTAILRFGERLAQADIDNGMALTAINPALPGEAAGNSISIRRRSLVALDKEEIHATQLFFENEMYIFGKPWPFVWPGAPISEALVDSKYALFSVALLKHSLSLQPLHMVLGVGSYNEKIARIFLALGWKHQKVPFFFYPVRPFRLLREIKVLRRNKLFHTVSLFLAFSGLGWLGSLVFSQFRRYRNSKALYNTFEEVDLFGKWADQIWKQCCSTYSALTRRDSAALNLFYPPGDRRYHRLRVKRAGEDVGWILVIIRKMGNNKYFGNLYVGTLVDGLCRPKDVQDVMNVGLCYLIQRKVDICVANWSHVAWKTASKKLGFLPGLSNFLYFVSQVRGLPLLTEACPLEQIHLSRGDGDGPINL